MTTLTERDTIGRRLRASRALVGFDQQQMADAVGVARTTVSGWERGHFEPIFSVIVKWSHITNQPLDWFAEGLDSDVVRPKGLEPPTFWSVAEGVTDWDAALEALLQSTVKRQESPDSGFSGVEVVAGARRQAGE